MDRRSLRVAEMTLNIAQELGIKDNELIHIRRGALLHDIGKMAIGRRPELLAKNQRQKLNINLWLSTSLPI